MERGGANTSGRAEGRRRLDRLRRIAIDLSPLRASRDFRALWFGLLVSGIGYQFTTVATFFQVYDMTRSAVAVGLIGLVGFTAILVGTLLGGTFVDVVDRRTTLIWTQVASGAGSLLLLGGVVASTDSVGVVYVGISLIAGSSAIDASVRNAMTPRLVGNDLLPAAIALNQVVHNTTTLIGPALAGIVIARTSLGWAYGIDVGTYACMLLVALSIRPVPPETVDEHDAGWAAVRRGFAYLKGRHVLQAAFGIDIVAMVFGMPRALFPILAITRFHEGLEVVGLLFAAPAVGAVLGALTGGWVGRIRHQGQAVCWAVAAWGASIAAFGVVGSNLGLAVLFLALAGASDVISAIFRGAIIQLSVPDAMRGRLSGINFLVVAGGPRLGDLEAGIVASLTTPAASVVAGGLACIAGAGLIAWLVPSFRRYRPPSAAANPAAS
jgi:MFS family permease